MVGAVVALTIFSASMSIVFGLAIYAMAEKIDRLEKAVHYLMFKDQQICERKGEL